MATASAASPEQGQLVSVRFRNWIVNEVTPSALPTTGLHGVKGALFATIRSFKGLEADAIIVTDVPDPTTTPYFSVSDLYVGCSRAKHILVVLAAEKGVL